ncbi:MAG: DUF3168 domain-containing protein, partial [Alphaproteobacteria bacterium]|nr:DUF3168 domain-containing protein [Alphaproteobacteria bacterium]
ISDVNGKDQPAAQQQCAKCADLTLSRGSLVGLYFVSAKARRVQDSDVRRIDLKFRARVEDN